MVKLTERLAAIAALVPPGARVADIGTDHGLLPCYLAERDPARRVIACDIAAGPLEAARRNVLRCGVARQVELRLGDGLQPLAPGEVDVAVLAGMGGTLMCGILDAAPVAVRDALELAILQPNNAADAVRRWAAAHGWRIAAEQLLRERGRWAVILALAPGEGQPPLSEAELYLGPRLLSEGHPLLPAYAADFDRRAQAALDSLAHSASAESRARAAAISQTRDAIRAAVAARFGTAQFVTR